MPRTNLLPPVPISERMPYGDLVLYIAGPMSDIPHFNFPAFERAAVKLRKRGYTVVSPAETDSPAVREAARKSLDGDMSVLAAITGETWGDLLAEDVRLIAGDKVDAVVVLQGWRKSRGARLETFVACDCGKPVLYYPSLRRVPRAIVTAAWAESWHVNAKAAVR